MQRYGSTPQTIGQDPGGDGDEEPDDFEGDGDEEAHNDFSEDVLDGSVSTSMLIKRMTSEDIYRRKLDLLNHAIQEIGMGRYQWELFCAVGFGWASDNLWPIVTSLIFTPVKNEFNPAQAPVLTLAQNLGLLVGAVFWGFSSDIVGRKLAFNLTLGITALGGLIAAASPNFATISSIDALWSFGVGGNLPVDSAIYLEFLPKSHQYTLVLLSVYWAISQLLATSLGWLFLGNMTCEEGQPCSRGQNMGWRYLLLSIGGITTLMFLARIRFFTLYESPKYLLSKGKDKQAVQVIQAVAYRNGKTSTLSLAELQDLDIRQSNSFDISFDAPSKSKRFGLDHVRALFATSELAYSTSLVMLIWASIGLGMPLYNGFLPFINASRGVEFGDGSTSVTYRNQLIIAVLGIPGAILGSYLVERPALGRTGTLALSAVMTGIFLFISTTARSSNALLVWNCAYNFNLNVLLAVLYAYTPEIFPTRHRGTGNALTAMSNRIFGIMAPLVAMSADLRTAAPVYVSGGLFIAAGVLSFMLPFESRGKASM